jgi:hypothetical protein
MPLLQCEGACIWEERPGRHRSWMEHRPCGPCHDFGGCLALEQATPTLDFIPPRLQDRPALRIRLTPTTFCAVCRVIAPFDAQTSSLQLPRAAPQARVRLCVRLCACRPLSPPTSAVLLRSVFCCTLRSQSGARRRCCGSLCVHSAPGSPHCDGDVC